MTYHPSPKEPDNLHRVYGVGIKPSDSQMLESLDEVSPEFLRQPFRTIFSLAQRGNALEQLAWLDGLYLLVLDDTGIYSSPTRSIRTTVCRNANVRAAPNTT